MTMFQVEMQLNDLSEWIAITHPIGEAEAVNVREVSRRCNRSSVPGRGRTQRLIIATRPPAGVQSPRSRGGRVPTEGDTHMLAELAPLTPEELEALTDTLWRGWHRAGEVYPRDFDGELHPLVLEAERTYMPVVNEFWGRQLGCRWTECSVCRHRSCSFCPTCNPGDIARNGEAYDDAEDTHASV